MEAQVILKEIRDETQDTRSFIFDKPAGLDFLPGQLMDWTRPHDNPDDRGETRPFSISSSPTEDFLMFTTKFTDPGSSFKRALRQAIPSTEFSIVGPDGSFLLPEDATRPIVFLGGGVGITPFRSQTKFATDQKRPTPLTLLYANKTPADIIYRTEFDQWSEINPHFKRFYIVDTPDEGWNGEVGRLSVEILKKYVPNLTEPLFYICGPAGMIEAYRNVLAEVGVGAAQIRTENFSGY